MIFRGARIVRLTPLWALLAIAPVALRADDRTTPVQPAVERSGAALVGDVLAAIGHDRDDAARHQRSFAALVDRLRATETVTGNARQRTRAIHEFMHAQILRGTYKASASDPGAALGGGSYNCASAAVLLVALAREFGVDAYPVSVVGHVWCRVETPSGSFDVETTCRDWFALADRRAAAGRTDPSGHSPAWQEHVRRAAVARRLDERAFLAIFHYNRGVGMLRQGQFPAAAMANLVALCLDWRCQPAYGNLAAALRGWSLARTERGKPEVSSAPTR